LINVQVKSTSETKYYKYQNMQYFFILETNAAP